MRRDSGGFRMLRGMTDPLVSDLRRFILSYGEHDEDCAGYDASGPAVVDPAGCTCGFIPRLEDLLRELEERLESWQ